MNKLKLWNQSKDWQTAEETWTKSALEAEKEFPLKKLHVLPKMNGMTDETRKNLKIKSLRWIIKEDKDLKIFKSVMKHPFRYLFRYLKSVIKNKPYIRNGDFFYYGIQSEDEFIDLLKDKESIFVIGFSYCHKPFECPSGRFTKNCVHDLTNPVCRQCFIGKSVHAIPDKNSYPLFIPTIHYIGGKIFDIIEENPKKKVIFLITACEMTLEMFGDLGNMVDIKGVGVRLDGRICNTMKAFVLSEQGNKPGLTVVLDETKEKMIEWIRLRREVMNEL